MKDYLKDNLVIHILGSSNPFSRTGHSSSYLISVNDSSYLIDCGAPLFMSLDKSSIDKIKGVIGTHSHDDHKRWFTDLVLYNKYITPSKLILITSERLHKEFKNSAKYALQRTLSIDSKKVIDVPYEEFLDLADIGPTAKIKIKKNRKGNLIVIKNNRKLPPSKAKIFIHPLTKSKRLLYKDEKYNEWIEPELFYSFKDKSFYERNRKYTDKETGLTFEAVNSPSWHGLHTIGIIIKYKNNRVFFSSDTVFDFNLWESFYKNKNGSAKSIKAKSFLNKQVITGDINNYIERLWSKKRFLDAINCYKNSDVIFHDIANMKSVVHTDAPNTRRWKSKNLIFIHSPDNFTARKPIAGSNRKYTVIDKKIYEVVDGRLYKLDAPIYSKNDCNSYVGYNNPKGLYSVVKENNLYTIVYKKDLKKEAYFNVDLYDDVGGKYYPVTSKIENYSFITVDNKITFKIIKMPNKKYKFIKVKNIREPIRLK